MMPRVASLVLSYSACMNTQNCSFSHFRHIVTCIVFCSLVFTYCFLHSIFLLTPCFVFPNVNSSRPLIKLSITWRKNGVPVSSGLSDFNRRLTVLSPALSDAGYYECEAVLRSSSVPSVSAGAYLHVQGRKNAVTSVDKKKHFWKPFAFEKNRLGSPIYFRAKSPTCHKLHLLYLLNLEKHLEYKNYKCLIFANFFITAETPWQSSWKHRDFSRIPTAQNKMLKKNYPLFFFLRGNIQKYFLHLFLRCSQTFANRKKC